MRLLPLLALSAFLLSLSAVAYAAPPGAVNQRGDGWPPTTGMVLLNQFDDDSRPLDRRPGMDPFRRPDPRYSCDAEHKNGMLCHHRFERCTTGLCVKPGRVHNKLLGGHGD